MQFRILQLELKGSLNGWLETHWLNTRYESERLHQRNLGQIADISKQQTCGNKQDGVEANIITYRGAYSKSNLPERTWWLCRRELAWFISKVKIEIFTLIVNIF